MLLQNVNEKVMGRKGREGILRQTKGDLFKSTLHDMGESTAMYSAKSTTQFQSNSTVLETIDIAFEE